MADGGVKNGSSKKNVRVNGDSSYGGLYEKVLVQVKRECTKSSSYWKFELSGQGDIGRWGLRSFVLWLFRSRKKREPVLNPYLAA